MSPMTHEVRLKSLRRANEIRLGQLVPTRREIRQLSYLEGRARVADLLEECPDWLRNQPVHLVLMWPYRMGQTTVRKLLALTGMRGLRTVGELTERQRKLLADGLRARGRERE